MAVAVVVGMLPALTVAACAAFAAHAVASLVEGHYLTAAPPQLGTAPVRVIEPSPPPPDGAALVARNMFCSTCEPAPGGPLATSAFVPDAILIATSIGGEPHATLRAAGSDVQGSFAVDDVVPGIGTITRIGFVSIDLVDGSGRTGTLSLLVNSGGRSDAGAATPAPAAADPWEGRVRKLDATTYEVERGLVRALVSGSLKTGGARIAPVSRNGTLDGLRLLGVRSGSLASALGLRNGDVLQAINNTRIENANTLLELYAQLDRLETVQLDGTRRGKPLSLRLRLR